MSAELTYTERELVLAMRQAVLHTVERLRFDRFLDTTSGRWYGAATLSERLYPLPKVERPRVVTDAVATEWRMTPPSVTLTDAQFLRQVANWIRAGFAPLRTDANRLEEISEMLDGVERAAVSSITDLLARVEALEAKANPAPSSSPPPEFSLPPVDPLEAITPTYQPDQSPSSPPAQERL